MTESGHRSQADEDQNVIFINDEVIRDNVLV